jgi:nucleoside 2-deoxyribosyltransferase
MTPVWAHVTANDHRAPPGFSALEDADIVLADLSFERPSCYFEVGFAQALGKRVALIATDGTAIHQVIGRDALIFYNTISDYENAVRLALERAGLPVRMSG